MIQAEHLQKTFRVRKRNAGFKNAAKAFFSREYEEIHALNDVSFRIEDGEAVGYIGPNGAGKSSTIKILSGILTPDSGTCVIDGRVPWKDRRAHVSQIGVVFGQRSQLWWDVPVIDSFELIRDIYAVTEDVYKRNLRDLTDLLDLSEILKTPARSLSLGQRMRCEIAASLLHDPRILSGGTCPACPAESGRRCILPCVWSRTVRCCFWMNPPSGSTRYRRSPCANSCLI